jgi:hypothetical protein
VKGLPRAKRAKTPKRPAQLRKLNHAARHAGTIDSIKSRYVSRLNNLHVGTQITVAALKLQLDQIASDERRDKRYHFRVPSSGGQPIARIHRDERGMRELMQSMIEGGEYSKGLLSAVSITEDFVANLLRLTLRAYPDRLLRGRRNGEAAQAVELSAIIGRTTEQVVDGVIEQRLRRMMQGSPKDYLRCAREWFCIELNDAVVASFVEIKATRDLLVHSDGVTDNTYAQKAGDLARVPVGSIVPMNRAYFDAAIATMKVLIATFGESLSSQYGDDRRLLDVLRSAD